MGLIKEIDYGTPIRVNGADRHPDDRRHER